MNNVQLRGLLLTDPDTTVSYQNHSAKLCSVTITVLMHYNVNEKGPNIGLVQWMSMIVNIYL